MTVPLIAIAGLAYDGSRYLAAQREADDVALQAARAGAQAVSDAAFYGGNSIVVDGPLAERGRAAVPLGPGLLGLGEHQCRRRHRQRHGQPHPGGARHPARHRNPVVHGDGERHAVAGGGRTVTSRRLGEVLRGLGATALLALLLVGVPVLLVMAVGQPWPQGIPTWDGIRRAFDTGVIPDGFFVKFVACVMWVAWLQLVVSFVVEVRAVVQDRSPERVPLVPGGMQVLVGRLVAATALVLSSFQVGAPTAAALVAGDGAGYQSAALVFDGPVGGRPPRSTPPASSC